MQRRVFIRGLGLKAFSLSAGDPETIVLPIACSQLCLTRVEIELDEEEHKGYGNRENMMTQSQRGVEERFTKVTLAEIGVSHTDKRRNWKSIHSKH